MRRLRCMLIATLLLPASLFAVACSATGSRSDSLGPPHALWEAKRLLALASADAGALEQAPRNEAEGRDVAAASPTYLERRRRASGGEDRPRPVLLLSQFGAVPNDDESDAGAVDAWLAECIHRDAVCHVAEPGRYLVGAITPRRLTGETTVTAVDGVVFDGQNDAANALWSVEANTDWRGIRFVNFEESTLFIISPRPDVDDHWTYKNAHEPLEPSLRHDIDHFRLIGIQVDGCDAVVNAASGGQRFGRGNNTISPDLADHPLIREVVIDGTMVRNCGGGYKLSMSRWGDRAAWERGEYPWRITNNIVENIDGSRCRRKQGYCGQAFEVGAHKVAFQKRNGGLLFKGNTIRHVTDSRKRNRRGSGEVQGLRVQGGYGALITENHFEDIWFQCPPGHTCAGDGFESNDEGIYIKNRYTTVERNVFVNMSYFGTEGGAVTAKSGAHPESGPDIDHPEWDRWAAKAPKGEPTFIRNNVIKWTGTNRTCRGPSKCNEPGRQIRAPDEGEVAENIFLGSAFEGWRISCVNCNGTEKVLIRLATEAPTEVSDNALR